METSFLTTMAFITLLTVAGRMNADERELDRDEVPKAVLDAFEKAHPNAKEVEFEKETFIGKEAYEVEYQIDGKEYEFLYGADGVLLQQEEEIDVSVLPEAIVNAIKKAHPKAKIMEAEKLLKPDGMLIGYEVEIDMPKGKKAELELDVNGNILKTEKE